MPRRSKGGKPLADGREFPAHQRWVGTAGKRGQRAISCGGPRFGRSRPRTHPEPSLARLGPRLPHGAIVEAPALERMPGGNRTRRPATPADQRMGCGWLRTPRQRRPSSINTGDRCSFIRELPAGRAEVSGANGQQGCHRRQTIQKLQHFVCGAISAPIMHV